MISDAKFFAQRHLKHSILLAKFEKEHWGQIQSPEKVELVLVGADEYFMLDATGDEYRVIPPTPTPAAPYILAAASELTTAGVPADSDLSDYRFG